ncbi:hypothetical protein EYF80_042009 [Liparis tanakae]|uniref:Uncharacterized protein n=1 Tax=Liparis tanakae TaxID=230148 RepID=A0A4Z2G5E3_9TELE|nr:hypothetical protein EYF80_042009 [Liparis tanakae]
MCVCVCVCVSVCACVCVRVCVCFLLSREMGARPRHRPRRGRRRDPAESGHPAGPLLEVPHDRAPPDLHQVQPVPVAQRAARGLRTPEHSAHAHSVRLREAPGREGAAPVPDGPRLQRQGPQRPPAERPPGDGLHRVHGPRHLAPGALQRRAQPGAGAAAQHAHRLDGRLLHGL